MAYSDIALLQQDPDFRARATAAVSVEVEQGNLPAIGRNATDEWVFERLWRLAAQPGFGDAYAYAVATGVPRPGNDPAVITDAQILAAVTGIYLVDHPAPSVTALTPDAGPVAGGTVLTITGSGFAGGA